MTKPGEIIGSYQLQDELGRGGMGKVYRASHSMLGRVAAIKVLDPQLASDAEYVSRFFHEARIVNEIRHPNIIDVIDFVDLKEPRRVAYVMELLEGAPMSDLIEGTPATLVQTVNAGRQIVSALEATHAVRVVHRDLKPENIFVLDPDSDWSVQPSIKILDFGIAKFDPKEVEHKTRTGAMVGTLAYMAPEQLHGEDITPATDVYALGEILFELITGRRLFDGSGTDVFRKKLAGTTGKIQTIQTWVADHALCQLVRQAVDSDPAKRPSLAEIDAALANIDLNAESLAVDKGLGSVVVSDPNKNGASNGRGTPPAGLVPIRSPSNQAAVSTSALPASADSSPFIAADPSASGFNETIVPESKSSQRPLVLAGLILGVLAAGVLIYTVLARSDRASMVQATAIPTPTVKLVSTPPGATVIDVATEESLGQTPLDVEIPNEVREVEVRLSGYLSQKQSLKANFGRMQIVLAPQPSKPAVEPPPPAPPPPSAKTPPPRTKPRVRKPVPEKAKAPPPPPTPSKPLRKNETTEW